MGSPADCLYSSSHEWHRVNGDTVTLGITRFAVDALTDVTYANMKAVGTTFAAGGIIGEVESVKTTSDIYCACAGQIVEVNKAVIDNPALLNSDPFGNWLIKAKISDKAGLSKLMSAADYDKAHPTG
jgi:glycine cleavage system H protein